MILKVQTGLNFRQFKDFVTLCGILNNFSTFTVDLTKNNKMCPQTPSSFYVNWYYPKIKAFEEVGRRGPYTPATLKGDPTRSFLVQNYLTFKFQEQGEAGVFPKMQCL